MSTEFRTYYKVLQIDSSAEQEIIEVAYRRLARKYHPDVNKSLDTTAKMQEINEAYDVLKDPIKRAAYDKALRELESKAAIERRGTEEQKKRKQEEEKRRHNQEKRQRERQTSQSAKPKQVDVYIICPKCGEPNSSAKSFCVNCWSSLENAPKRTTGKQGEKREQQAPEHPQPKQSNASHVNCPKCGEPNLKDNLFCISCWIKL